MIRSMRVVLCRTLLAVLATRGVKVHAVAEATAISIVEVQRLIEFGSPLDAATGNKFVPGACACVS